MAPTFKARKGSFKKRVAKLPEEVDFFGKTWTAAMSEFLRAVGDIGGNVEDVFRFSAGQLFGKIQTRTPKDTGHAQSSWRFLPQTKTGDDIEIIIVNGVEYIVYLEFGWSKQAPQGMVRKSLKEMTGELMTATQRLIA